MDLESAFGRMDLPIKVIGNLMSFVEREDLLTKILMFFKEIGKTGEDKEMEFTIVKMVVSIKDNGKGRN